MNDKIINQIVLYLVSFKYAVIKLMSLIPDSIFLLVGGAFLLYVLFDRVMK